MRRLYSVTALVTSMGVFAAADMAPAFAEATDSVADQGFAIEEVVVTATKRDTRLQDTPISIAAFSEGYLEKNNVKEFSDFVNAIPNVSAPEGLNGGGNNIAIRGISSQTRQGVNNDQPAGAYLDQVFQGPRGFLDNAVFDIAQIEVLRGPQGTLWGRNTAAGAISYTSRRPTQDFEGYAEAEAGNYDALTLRGAVSGPLAGDKVLFRAAGIHYERDGYIKRVSGGSYGTENQDAARLQLQFLPTDDLDLLLIGQYLASDYVPDIPTWTGLPGFSGPAELNPGGIYGKRYGETNFTPFSKKDVYGLTSIANYRLGDFTLTSVTGYQKISTYGLLDDEGTALDIATLDFGSAENPETTKRFSQEFRIASPTLWNLIDFTAGLYYYNEKARTQGGYHYGTFLIDQLGIELPDGVRTFAETSASASTTNSYAAFGQANIHVTDRLTGVIGLRVNREKKEFATASGMILYGPNGEVVLDMPTGPLAPLEPFKDDVLTKTLGLNYKPTDDSMVYATYSEGYKSGGFNQSYFSAPDSIVPFFGPEKVKNYEAGVRTSWLDRRLTVNLTAFYMTYEDLQVEIQSLTGAGQFVSQIANAGKARSQGAELEVVAMPTAEWQINFSAGWLDAVFKEFAANAVDDLSGNRLPFAPKLKFSLGSRYDIALGDSGNLYLQGEWAHSSGYFPDVTNNPNGFQKHSDVFNGRVGFEPASGKWEIGFWMRNITNKALITDYNPALESRTALFFGSTFYAYSPPRTFGVDLKVNF